MKVFLSWSGERSKAAAIALREWLPLLLHYIEPWISDRDLSAGERWSLEIGRELEEAQFGIILLTSENLNAPWLLFEAGALSKAFNASAVIPYLIDVELKDLVGPLAQFQAKKADRQSTYDLLLSLNSRAAQPLDKIRVTQLFDALWPKLAEALDTLPGQPVPSAARSQSQVLEDLVTAMRRLESRISVGERVLRPAADGTFPVRVEVHGAFPSAADGVMYEVPGSGDVFEAIARLSGVDLQEYGATWELINLRSGTTLTRDASIILGRRGRPEHLALYRLLPEG